MKIRLARRYAQALFRLARKRQVVHEVKEELALVEQVFAGTEVFTFFENPSVPAVVKKETIVRLFGACVSGLVQNFLCQLLDKWRIGVLPEVIKDYRALVKQISNVLEVRITTATPLAAKDSEQLVARLTLVTGKEIELQPQVDQRILGGLIMQIGDKRIDDSVAGKLAVLKSHMLNKSY